MSWIKTQSEYDELDKYEDHYKTIVYYKKNTDILHNPYGAALIYSDGAKIYYINNKLHRLDGPAKIYSNCNVEYYINDMILTKEEFEGHPERLKYLGKEHLICLG